MRQGARDVKANLKIRNVGGLKGERTFEFERGRVSLLESSNSSGKSSVIRGLLAALSLSQEELSDKSYLNESVALGIHVDPQNTGEGFVNIHSNEAQVALAVGSDLRMLTLRKDGRVLEDKGNVDPKFIFAGILSNDSRILRQLRGVTDTEPDDFEWAVSEMSLAKWYENISSLTATKMEDLEKSSKNLDATIKKNSDLEKATKRMVDQIKEIDSKIQDLNIVLKSGDSKYKGDFNKKRNDLISDIDEFKKNKAKTEASIEETQKAAKKIQKEQEKLEEAKRNLVDELGKIDLQKEQERIEKEKKVLERKLEELKEKKSGMEGVLNLLVLAEDRISNKAGDTTCPLCEDGRISLVSLKKRLTTLRSERDSMTQELLGLAENRREFDSGFEQTKDRIKELKKKTDDTRSQISSNKQLLDELDIGGLAIVVEEYSKKIEAKDQKLNELYALVSSSDMENFEKSQMLEKERDRTNNEMIANQRDIERSKVTLYDRTLSPKDGLAVVNRQIGLLQTIIKEMNNRADAQKEEARKLFNASIKGLLDKLRFEEFRSVALNRDYRLYVERFDERRHDYVKQNASTLSTSEKLAIALILQVALKETYVPKTPFLLVDDVLEDLDEGRLDTVLKYLSSKAKEADWFVVATKLVKGQVEPRITTFKG